MDVIYGLLPLMIVLGLVSVALMFWAAKSGQFDDMDGDANRILMDEDIDVTPEQPKQSDDKDESNKEVN
jgi:cbb3-type cytochrome oxidase maturation protein